MWRPNIRNRTFDWMGEQFAPFIDRDHFLGHSSIGHLKWNLPVVRDKPDLLFKIQLLIPGYFKKELTIRVEDDRLIVAGEKNRKRAALSANVLQMASTDRFDRSYQLLPGTGRERISATYRKGVLEITAERSKKKRKALRRSVKVQ